MALKGIRVFISRKDFPAQFIDSAQDMLRENGAEPCICSNPTCNAKTDFHVLPSSEQEKIKEYIGQGCNVIGPDCLVRCAKEHRPFPKQQYTCCLAMEGVKVLATGFEKAEKIEIERLVTAMCGEIEAKTLSNASFIISKDVLSAKYKFALNNLKRPILKMDWLHQCWREHRLVPHESYRLPPFAGLTICATNVPLEDRKEIEEICNKNGGIYSADLTKKCSHLIAYIPQGDKFKVARKWGTVKIVNKQWFGQCLAAKACLDEDLFPVTAAREKSITASQLPVQTPFTSQLESVKSDIVISSATSVVANTVCSEPVQSVDNVNGNPDGYSFQGVEPSADVDPSEEIRTICDGEEEMYLANCRIYFTGFPVSDIRKYVNMVRDGGATRHMEFNDRITHVITGKPTASEWREIRQKTSMKGIQVVLPIWLEDCYRQRKEVVVSQRHLVPDSFLSRETTAILSSRRQQYPSSQNLDAELDSADIRNNSGKEHMYVSGKKVAGEASQIHSLEKSGQLAEQQNPSPPKVSATTSHFLAGVKSPFINKEHSPLDKEQSLKTDKFTPSRSNINKDAIFSGCVFAICESFPLERRDEIVQWVVEAGGLMVDVSWKDSRKKIDYLVVDHGTKITPSMLSHVKPVSSHWIRFCLEEKELLCPESHILYRPLQCRVPLPGFEAFRICVSQYEDKDRALLRNLCFVLGAKFTEKLNKKVTHLLVQIKDGAKYDAACKWGIEVTAAEWLFACVSKDSILPLEDFQPRELSASEMDAGLLGMTQCPTQAARLARGEMASQWADETPSKFQEAGKMNVFKMDEDVALLSERNKYFVNMATEDPADHTDIWDDQRDTNMDEQMKHSPEEDPNSDVAAAIEGLLAQTSKFKSSNGTSKRSALDQEISPEHIMLKRTREQNPFKRTKLQEMSSEEPERPSSPAEDTFVFDESQMESQVIGYDEDHTGKHLIMERVRTRSMSTVGVGRPSRKSWKNNGLGRLFKVAEDNK